MKRTIVQLARRATVLGAVLLAAGSVQAKPDAVSTQRFDAQAGCPAKKPVGALSLAKGTLQGQAKQALQAMPNFAAIHTANTTGEGDWLAKATGRSGPNRIYREKRSEIIVVTLCNPAMCPGNRAYVGWEPATGAWGVTVFEGRNTRDIVAGAGQTTMAILPDLIGNALICAANADMGEP